jgi:RHS repeat-associated protein
MVTDSQGYITQYIYDDFGRAVRVDTSDSGMTRYTYNEVGNMTGRKFASAGTGTTFTYDALNRQLVMNYPSTTDTSYTYDSTTISYTNCRTGAAVPLNNLQGRLAKVTDMAGTTWFSYDNDGRRVTEAWRANAGESSCARVAEWTYDPNGNVETVRYPTGRLVTYEYPAYPGDVDRPSVVKVSYGAGTTTVASNIGYHAGGRLRTFDYGNGLTAQFTQWLDRSPKELATCTGCSDPTPVYWLRFLTDLADLDGVGNIKKIQDEINARLDQTFSYDDMYRLDLATVADSTGGSAYSSQDFAYTGVTEKRSSIARDGGAPQTYSYPWTNNRLESAEGTTYAYNADGNVSSITSGSTTNLFYDDEQRLYYRNSTSDWLNRYDFRNQKRHLRRWDSGLGVYRYNYFFYASSGHRMAHLGEFTSGGYPRPLKEYVHFGGRRIVAVDATMTSQSAVTDNSLDYVHGNHLDAPVAVTDANKTMIWKAQYDPFGQVAFNTEKRTLSGSQYSTPHPYGDLPGCYGYAPCLKWDSGPIKWPGAARVRVKFSGFQTELNYDQARIYDKDSEQIFTYHGSPNPNTFWSEWVEGDTIQVKLWVDVSVNYNGFDLTELEAEFKPLHTSKTPLQGNPSFVQMTHPHPNSGCSGQACAVVWASGPLTYTGAVRVRAKLDKLVTQIYWDKVRVYNANDAPGAHLYQYEGPIANNNGSFWTEWVSGNTIQVKLEANNTPNPNTYYGFDLTEVEVDYGTTYTMHARLPGQWNEPETGLVYNWHRHYDPKIGRYLGVDRWSAQTPYAYVQNRPLIGLDASGQSPHYGWDYDCDDGGEDCTKVAASDPVEPDPTTRSFSSNGMQGNSDATAHRVCAGDLGPCVPRCMGENVALSFDFWGICAACVLVVASMESGPNPGRTPRSWIRWGERMEENAPVAAAGCGAVCAGIITAQAIACFQLCRSDACKCVDSERITSEYDQESDHNSVFREHQTCPAFADADSASASSLLPAFLIMPVWAKLPQLP